MTAHPSYKAVADRARPCIKEDVVFGLPVGIYGHAVAHLR